MLCRIHRDGVTGVDAGALHQLHDSRQEHVGAVADGVDLDFLALDVFVDENRILDALG